MSSSNPHRPGGVLVIGSINEDVIMLVPRAPRPGETLTAKRTDRRAGGKGANQAVAAARARAEVRMLGRVGDDAAGTRMLDALRDEGVDTDLVEIACATPTGAAYITVTDDGENAIVLDRGANACLSPADVEGHRETIANAAVLLAQLEIPVDAVTAAVQAAVGAGVRPVVTLSPAQDVPSELLAGLDPLLVNEHEAAFLLGDGAAQGRPEDAAERLLRLGPRSAVITLGADGAVFATGDGASSLPAEPTEKVIDTTGAGDAFAGTLAAALAAGGELRDAVHAGLA
ncbi:MAG: ribokinase, partial [Solirubrobacteraceae bacterium]